MRVWLTLIAIALLAIFVMPAQADRLEDIQERVSELAQQRILISNEILRLEGMFMERQAVIAEAAALVEKESEVVEPEVNE